MFSRSSMDHIVRDLIVRWQRIALVAVLLIVALSIWLPLLISALLSKREANGAGTETANSISTPVQNSESVLEESRFSLENTEQTLTPQKNDNSRPQPDPLTRSIEVSPFQNLNDDPPGDQSSALHIKNRESAVTETTLDTIPRTGITNGRQNTDRSEIHINGKTYRLEHVKRNSVE